MAAESPMGSAVIARMNRIHGHYAISDDDFNSVLSTFVAEPIRWLERPVPLLEARGAADGNLGRPNHAVAQQ